MLSRRALATAFAAVLCAPIASPASATVYAFSRGAGYTGNHEVVVPSMTLPKGTTLVFVNLHVWGHNITSDAWAPEHVRLFRSDFVAFGEQAVVEGVDRLERGTYGFFCRNHIGMRGSITIV